MKCAQSGEECYDFECGKTTGICSINKYFKLKEEPKIHKVERSDGSHVIINETPGYIPMFGIIPISENVKIRITNEEDSRLAFNNEPFGRLILISDIQKVIEGLELEIKVAKEIIYVNKNRKERFVHGRLCTLEQYLSKLTDLIK